jgi:hypothetical protein
MKTVRKPLISSMLLSALALLAPIRLVQAGDDFLVVQASDVSLGDNGSSQANLVKDFVLPNAFAPGSLAILQLRAAGVDYPNNAVYLNPPIQSCFSNNGDPNLTARVGRLEAHEAAGEWYTYYRLVSPQAGTNTLMICPRAEDGSLTGNVDDFKVATIVLHFKTTP